KQIENPENVTSPEVAVYESSRISAEVIERAKGHFFAQQAEAAVDGVLANRAIPLLSSWVRNHPKDSEALSLLGTSYSLSQNVPFAIESLEKSLAIDPESEYALRQLMILSHDNG